MRSCLIIDDNVEFARGLKIALRRDYTAECAQDAFTARQLLLEKEYNIVLCDVRMPYFGGLDFAEQLKRRFIRTPLIFITGDANRDISKRAFELGAANIIQKPFDLDDLLNKMAIATDLLGLRSDESVNHELGYVYNLLKFHYYDINEILYQIQYHRVSLDVVKSELEKKQRIGRCHLDDLDSIKLLSKAA